LDWQYKDNDDRGGGMARHRVGIGQEINQDYEKCRIYQGSDKEQMGQIFVITDRLHQNVDDEKYTKDYRIRYI